MQFQLSFADAVINFHTCDQCVHAEKEIRTFSWKLAGRVFDRFKFKVADL